MTTSLPDATAQAQNDTVVWLERAVIGLNLCPFAKAVHVKGQIRYAVCLDSDPQAVLDMLKFELKHLVAQSPSVLDTTLLIAPNSLIDFFDYNDFLPKADKVLCKLKLQGEIQIASFHPHYQFAGEPSEAISNFTNRSPYPMLHLIREASIDRAVAAFPEASAIFEANMRTMEALGTAGWQALDVGARI